MDDRNNKQLPAPRYDKKTDSTAASVGYEIGIEKKPVYRPRSQLTPVESILRSVLARQGIDQKLAEYSWIQHWSEIVGDAIAKRAKPRSLQGGVLTIDVESSVWAQELQFRRTIIITRLRRYIKSDTVVKELRFMVRTPRRKVSTDQINRSDRQRVLPQKNNDSDY